MHLKEKTSLLLIFLLFFSINIDSYATEPVRTFPLPTQQKQLHNHQQKGIHIKGIVRIIVEEHLKQYSELSGLSWDQDEGILYAISDKGYLNHLKPIFQNGILTGLEFIAHFPLMAPNGVQLTAHFSDSEGLTAENSANSILGDTTLLISFERKPRVDRYTSDGKFLASVHLPTQLQQVDFYEHGNSALESVEVHPTKGILLAAERLKGNPSTLSLFNQQGQQWSFQAASPKHGSATGMTLTTDNNILLIERVFSNVFMGVRFALHHIILGETGIQHQQLAYIGPKDGLFNDNFEGITHHNNNHYFMIADDNRSALQRAILVYFSIPKLNQPNALLSQKFIQLN